MSNTPKVTLIRWTPDPVGAVYDIWQASKTQDPLESGEFLQGCDGQVPPVFDAPAEEKLKIFKDVLRMNIPIAEFVDFVFIFEDMSIAMREQLVRERVSMPVYQGEPYWLQSQRILSQESFADNGDYMEPALFDHMDDVLPEDPELMLPVEYMTFMLRAQNLYKKLVAAGIPHEEARLVIPLAATHRGAVKYNLRALKMTVSKRACWILQAGFWKPFIAGMMHELTTKVGDFMSELVSLPCDGKACPYHEDNVRRWDARDPLPPCPIWENQNHEELNAGKYGDVLYEPLEQQRMLDEDYPWVKARLEDR